MRKSTPAPDPDAYVAALAGWQRRCVATLRAAVRASAKLEEVVKWGHLVYGSNGPVLLIRAEADRVLFGFWRGQRLRAIDERLKPGGKFEMATLELRENISISPATARRLTREAVALNATLGDPTRIGIGPPPARMTPASIDDYIASCAREFAPILERIRATIRRAAPDAQETISYRIPSFTQNGALVYFAAFKHHIGFYPPVRGDVRLEKAVAPYAGEKGNLRFPLDRPIPYALIERIVKHRVKQNLAKAATKPGKKL